MGMTGVDAGANLLEISLLRVSEECDLGSSEQCDILARSFFESESRPRGSDLKRLYCFLLTSVALFC